MKRPSFPRLAAVLLLAPALAPAVPPPINEGTLTLVNESGFNEFNVGLSVSGIGSDSDTSAITGSLLARLDIDPATGQSPEFTILDGSFQGTPISLMIPFLIFDVVDVSSTTIGGTVVTPVPPGTINPTTGEGDAAQHEFTIDQGTVSGTATNPLTQESTPINIDFATEPVSGNGQGTLEVTITPAGTDATRGYYDITMVLPVNLAENVDNDLGLTATFTVAGTFKAAGQVSVPLSDYLAWTEVEGIPGADPNADDSGSGIVNGMMWALGLGLADNPRPYLPRPSPLIPRGFLITLPPGGTGGPLFIDSSTTLAPGSWSLIDPAELSAPANPLPAGTTGTIVVAASALPARYVRLHSEP